MISEIIDHLCITFRCSGENVNEQIHESEEALLNLSHQTEFYPLLFQIISSNEIPEEIRKAAMNYLQFSIKRWSDMLDEGSQIFIVENYPALLEHSYQFFDMSLKLTENLVDCTFYAGNLWPNLFDVILSGFSEFEKEKEKTFSSIFLLNAISRHFKKRYDIEPFPIVNNFYPFLRDFIFFSLNHLSEGETEETNFNLLPFAATCYQTINFFNSSQLSEYFSENIDDFNALLFQTTQIACFEKMNCTVEEFIYFSKQAMKFSAKMIKRYPEQIKDTIPLQILQSLFEFFSKFHNNELVLSSVARLINSFLSYEPTCQYIIENECPNFIIKLVFPFYFLNVQDIEDSKNDPSQFLAKFQTQNYFYESESRSFLYQTLVRKTKELCEGKENPEFPQLSITIFQIFTKVIENYINEENSENFQGHQEKDDALLFSIFFIFSTIHPSIPYLNTELFSQLVELLSKLFESSSHLVISGVLFFIKSISQNVYFPPQFYMNTLNLLISHPSQLVRYYAATTFYEMIRITYRSDYQNESGEESQEKNILDECSQHLPSILQAYFEVSIEFNDFELIELLTNTMTIFCSSLISDASQLICQVFEMFLNNQDLAQSSNQNIFYLGENILDSLFRFIKEIFVRNPEISADSIIEPLLDGIFQVLTSTNTYQINTYQIIFEFIAKLSFISSFYSSDENVISGNFESISPSLYSFQFVKRNGTFSPIFWKLYEIIPQIIENTDSQLVEDGIYAMRSIFICNSETGLNEEILNFTLQLCDKYMSHFLSELDDCLFATMLFLSTVFVIAPPNSLSNIEENFQNLIVALKDFFQHYESNIYSSTLFIAMLIQNSSIVFQILNNSSSLLNEEEEDVDNKSDFVVQFCLEWFDISNPYFQMFFILNFNQLFSKEIIAVFIQKTLVTFRKNFETFDLDDSDQKIDLFFSPSLEKKAPICSLILLDASKILENFTQFMQLSAEDYPELAEKFNDIVQIKENYLNNDEDFADYIFEDDDDDEMNS